MARIRIHQTLPTHRKTFAAAEMLDVIPEQFIGHLTRFWLWAVDNLPSGEILDMPISIIEDASNWRGEPDLFFNTLVATGFIDEIDGQFFLHDWHEHTGKLISRKKHEAKRKKAHRELYNNHPLVEAIRNRDKDMCRYCGSRVNWYDRKGRDGATCDYVEPDGPTTLENIVLACRACNSGKNQRTPEEAGYILLHPPQSSN